MVRYSPETLAESEARMKLQMKTKGYSVHRQEKITLVRHRNGDRIVLFNRNLRGRPVEAFFPEHWTVETNFSQSFQRSRWVAQIRSFGRRRLFVKDVSQFGGFSRPRNKQFNTRFSEARILLELSKQGHSPEAALAVVMRPGYAPVLVTSMLGGRMATVDEATRLKESLHSSGFQPIDLVNLKKLKVIGFKKTPSATNAKVSKGVVHPFDAEFYRMRSRKDEVRLRRKNPKKLGLSFGYGIGPRPDRLSFYSESGPRGKRRLNFLVQELLYGGKPTISSEEVKKRLGINT